MTYIPTTSEDQKLIDKMKRKSIFLLVGMLFMYLILFAVGSPSRLVVNGETVINNKGIPDVLLVLLALLIIVLDIVLAKKISSPLQKALDEECDPRKHFVLCRAFLRSKKKQLLQESVDYLYLGCYPSCLECTEKILTYSNTAFRLCGLFNKARVCFFRGDQETFTQALKQYEAEFNGKKHMRKRTRAILGNWLNNMDLLAAIMRNDVDAAGQYRTVTSWSKSKMTEGYVNYVKGLAAKLAGDNEAAAGSFSAVIDTCKLNVLAELAEKQL